MNKEDLYIGWSEDTPEKNRKALKTLLIPVFLFIPIICLIIVVFMKPFNNHTFELGKIKEFTGIYYEEPFPVLILDNGESPSNSDNHAMLVGYGKNGAKGFFKVIQSRNGDMSGKKIKIRGTLIYGDGKTLIELTQKENSFVEIVDNDVHEYYPNEHNTIELKGEILDPKCWFGVMKPGEGKVHKSCAIRCISGGIPPVLRSYENGKNSYYILRVIHAQDVNKDILQFVAEPIQLKANVTSINGWFILQIDPDNIKLTNIDTDQSFDLEYQYNIPVCKNVSRTLTSQ